MLNSPLVIGFVENGVVHVTRPKFLDDAFPCIDWLIQKIIYQILPFNRRLDVGRIAKVRVDATPIQKLPDSPAIRDNHAAFGPGAQILTTRWRFPVIEGVAVFYICVDVCYRCRQIGAVGFRFRVIVVFVESVSGKLNAPNGGIDVEVRQGRGQIGRRIREAARCV